MANWGSGYIIDAKFDQFISPAVFNDSGTFKIVAGNYNGTWNGWYWNGSTWVRDNSIVNGLPNLGFVTACGIFTHGGYFKMIIADSSGYTGGYYWSGSMWTADSSIVAGLGYLTSPSFTLFYDASVLKLIIGCYNAVYKGYYWNGSTWVSDGSIVSGLSGISTIPAPTIFDDDGTWKIIEGANNGLCYGWYWNGSTWIRDDTIKSGITDVGAYAHPCVYLDGSQLKIVVGCEFWNIYGWEIVTYTISGNVKSIKGTNLHNATVTLENGTDYSTDTDINGDYSQVVRPDIYTVAVSKEEHCDCSDSVDASSSDMTKDFVLQMPVRRENIVPGGAQRTLISSESREKIGGQSRIRLSPNAPRMQSDVPCPP